MGFFFDSKLWFNVKNDFASDLEVGPSNSQNEREIKNERRALDHPK